MPLSTARRAAIPSLLNIFLACVAPSLFWLGYWVYRGHLGKRRWRPIWAFFAAGVLAGPLALALFEAVELSPFYEQIAAIHEMPEVEKFAYALFAIGPIEEMAKFIVAWACMRILAGEVDIRAGGMVYAAAAALGFATIENWYYMLAVDEVLWHRALTLPFNHVLFSSFWGVGLSLYSQRGHHGPVWLIAGLVLSFVYHGLYDFILLSDEIPNIAVLPLILGLWLWLVAAIPRLRRTITPTTKRATP
jgi:RsiW-degrading membrane proteinase PrsW (M82 family)